MGACYAEFTDLATIVALRPGCEDALTCKGLYVTGSLGALAGPTVAVVGTRAASVLGKSTAQTLAAELAQAGICVVSGLAVGIDTAAHQGALESGGATIGVLGGGHQRFFPKCNLKLANRIAECGGAVLSPYPPDEPARPHHFLQRNGVVAALADAVVVVEAPVRSGALNTANWAAGRVPVLAFPGDVDRLKVAGCLELIRDGAILARNADDVLATLGLFSKARSKGCARERAPRPTDPTQAKILQTLGELELTLDTLINISNLSAADVLSAITLLETSGVIERRDGSCVALATQPPS